MAKMADSQPSGVGEEPETEKEDKGSVKKAVRVEKPGDSGGLTETLRFDDKKSSAKDKKRNLSGKKSLKLSPD